MTETTESTNTKPPDSSRFDWVYRWGSLFLWGLMALTVFLLAIFALLNVGWRTYHLVTDTESRKQEIIVLEATPPGGRERFVDIAEALERANASLGMAETVLSFLEGASVLVALALGAAAIFGFQNARELRKDVEEERNKINALLGQLEPVQKDLASLPDRLTVLNNIENDFMDLLQANQELSLKNYEEAYHYVNRVLDRSPKNVQALYIAGWLENQYIPNSLPKAKEHLKQALAIDPNSQSVKAAYGVTLRRMAGRMNNQNERENLWRESLGYLLQALGANPLLIDLNRESFWGPVGGNYRDLNQVGEAIRSYEKARDVTPGSSYPIGNLGALYLQQAKQENNPENYAKALHTFEETVELSDREKGYNPNDYFVLMDLAMAYTMLGAENLQNFEKAQKWFDFALSPSINATSGMLRVSLGGWQRLYEYCPDDWPNVQNTLEQRILQIKEAIEQRQEKQATH